MTITSPGKSRVLSQKSYVRNLGNELWNQVRKIKIGLSVWEGVNTFDISRSWIGPFFDILNGKIKIFNFLAATDFGNLQRTNSLISSTIDTKTPIITMDLVMFKIGKFLNWNYKKGLMKGGIDAP